MADSKTTSKPSPSMIGSLVGAKDTSVTTITTDSGEKFTGYGATAKESQHNASRKAGQK